jgi:shikimate dehydrogenase
MRVRLDRDTQLCASLSARPGKFGTRFHNFLFEALDLGFAYKAFATSDIAGAIAGLRALGFRGAGISMPFKETCIPLLDELSSEAQAIGAVNTIVQTEGRLHGYNTDVLAVRQLLATRLADERPPFLLRGSGGMARAILHALHQAGFREGTVIARNEASGRKLAAKYGWGWEPELPTVSGSGGARYPLLINATPIGMHGTPAPSATAGLPFSLALIAQARWVFESVAVPAETGFLRAARDAGVPIRITGSDILVLQGVEQFVLYTGQRPEPELVERAAAFAFSD